MLVDFFFDSNAYLGLKVEVFLWEEVIESWHVFPL